MALELNLDNYGEGRVAPGKCHVQVTQFLEYGEPKSGSHIAELEVLAHEDPDQVGKTFKDFMPDPARTPKAVFRLIEFAVGCGLLTREKIKEHQRNGTSPAIEPTDSAGKQMFVELVEEEYQGKTNTKVKDGRGYYRIDDPKAKGFPRHEGMLKQAGHSATNGSASTAGAAAPKAEADPF